MVFGLFERKKANQRIVARLYETLTAAGRQPLFYETMGVPDTVMGRFEMLSLHVALFLRRVREASPIVRDVAQELVDAFFEDIDHSIRELGIGDMGVPKRMKKFAGMFYGRVNAYSEAIDAGNVPALAAALARNIYPEPGGKGKGQVPPAADRSTPDMTALARYAIAAGAALAAVDEADILAGNLTLPDAAALATAQAEPRP